MTAERAENQDCAETPPLEDKVAFLSSPANYPGVAQVEAKETRMAWVFLAGDRVYKLKKPVRHPHLDYSTRAARRGVCQDEVRLNRRLAPDVYLGVARLTRESDGSLAIDGKGTVVDWLVEMRRLPRARMLDNAIRAGAASRASIEHVADRLVRFYEEAPPVELDPEERVAALAEQVEQGRKVLADPRFARLAGRGTEVLDGLAEALEQVPQLVTARIEAGRILEGHGDLRPEHVCLTDPPVIIDCLEFSRELRLVDPFDELAYLSMECAVLGARWIGPILLERCAAGLGERPSGRTLAFYTVYRGALRARQALEHLLEPEPRTPEKWIPKAEAYLDEATRALVTLRPPEVRPATPPRADGG